MDANSIWLLVIGVLGAVGGWLFRKPVKPGSPVPLPSDPTGPAPSAPSVTLTGPLAELLLPLVRLLQDPTFGPAIKPFVEGFITWARERIFPTRDGSAMPFAGNPWAPPPAAPQQPE